MVLLIFFEMVELHCLDRIMRWFNYKQHITIANDTSDALHIINHRGKNNDYNWLCHHKAYESQRDVHRNEIFTKMYIVITNDEYLIRYMSITHQVSIPGPNHVFTTGYMQYKQHTKQIQNNVIKYSL